MTPSCSIRTAIVSYLSLQLAKQKKLDFKPKNDDDVYSRLNTEPCLLACEFLTKVRDATGRALTGRNAEVFLTEVGVTFHTCVSLSSSFLSFGVEGEGKLTLRMTQTPSRAPQEVYDQRDGRSHAHQARLFCFSGVAPSLLTPSSFVQGSRPLPRHPLDLLPPPLERPLRNAPSTRQRLYRSTRHSQNVPQ